MNEIMTGNLAFAMYKPREGKTADLMSIVQQHVPRLREFGLITPREAILAQSADGTVIEIFEWESDEAKQVAHQHPAIMELWGRMMPICDFPSMKDLPEAGQRFPNFTIV